MNITVLGRLGLGLLMLCAFGCGTYSIPRVAVKGTTIVFTVPDAFGAGFGRALNHTLQLADINSDLATKVVQLDPSLDDLQRGELVFVLRDGPTIEANRKAYLPLRYITRGHVDEASGAALPTTQDENYINVGTPIETGQIVAFVDIPNASDQELPPGIYYVFVERWRRNRESISGGSSTFEQIAAKMIGYSNTSLPWRSWGGFGGWGGWTASSPDAGFRIRIVNQQAPPGTFFHDPAVGFDRWNDAYSYLDHTADLPHLAPNLQLRIWIGDLATLTFPAAWELELAYPAGKFEIAGATLGSIHRSGGLVSVKTSGSASGCEGSGTARISLVAPDRDVQWIDLVYRLKDFATCGRAVPGDFTPVASTSKAYDLDGNAISPVAFFDPEYSY